jgi:hypothetical protein
LVQADITSWRELGHLRQTATELAFKKHRLARRGQDPTTQKDIDRHRERLAELGATPLSQDSSQLTSEPTPEFSGSRALFG